MAKGKGIVVDASVARAAGGREHPTSKNCTDFLSTLRDDTQHSLLLSSEIIAEWRKHASHFATAWQKSMIAKKRVTFLRDAEALVNVELRDLIDTHAETDKARQEMLKDVHLIEAALSAAQIIASLNEAERHRFAQLCAFAVMIRRVMWVNPDKPDEECLDWLKAGADWEDFRTLASGLDT